MSQITIGWRDVEGLEQFAGAIKKIESQQAFGDAARIANNKTGDKARTQVVRALVQQTGLPRKIIDPAVVTVRTNYTNYQYTMTTRGGDVSLKFFAPREFRSGVRVKLPGGLKTFAGTFRRGGHFPNRVSVAGFGGHVFQRDGGSRFPIRRVNSGVIIPVEMLRGKTLRVFKQTVREELPLDFAKQIKRLTNHVFS